MVISPSDSRALKSIFLAGTIDMGNSHDWQKDFIEIFDSENVVLVNPRRVVSLEAMADIDYQIRWELTQIKKADAIFMYFAPGSMSPITLLELGLCLQMKNKKMVVVCPKEYARYQNVKITVDEFRRPSLKFAETWVGGIEDFKSLVRDRL